MSYDRFSAASHAESVHRAYHGWSSVSGVPNSQKPGKQSGGAGLAV